MLFVYRLFLIAISVVIIGTAVSTADPDSTHLTELLVSDGTPHMEFIQLAESGDSLLIRYDKTEGTSPTVQLIGSADVDSGSNPELSSPMAGEVIIMWLQGPGGRKYAPNTDLYIDRGEGWVYQGNTGTTSYIWTEENSSAGDRFLAIKQFDGRDAVKSGHEAVDNKMYTMTLNTDYMLTGEDNNGQYASHVASGFQLARQLYLTHAIFKYNLVVSVEWDIENTDYYERLVRGLKKASRKLYDATDGQAYFHKIAIYDEKDHWYDCDVRVYDETNYRAATKADGIFKTANLISHQQIKMGRTDKWGTYPGDGTWSGSLIHEFGHYAFGFYDEYLTGDGIRTANVPRWNPGGTEHPYDYELMDDNTSEMSSSNFYLINYDWELVDLGNITMQLSERHMSCWDYFAERHDGYHAYATVKGPQIGWWDDNSLDVRDFPNESWVEDSTKFEDMRTANKMELSNKQPSVKSSSPDGLLVVIGDHVVAGARIYQRNGSESKQLGISDLNGSIDLDGINRSGYMIASKIVDGILCTDSVSLDSLPIDAILKIDLTETVVQRQATLNDEGDPGIVIEGNIDLVENDLFSITLSLYVDKLLQANPHGTIYYGNTNFALDFQAAGNNLYECQIQIDATRPFFDGRSILEIGLIDTSSVVTTDFAELSIIWIEDSTHNEIYVGGMELHLDDTKISNDQFGLTINTYGLPYTEHILGLYPVTEMITIHLEYDNHFTDDSIGLNFHYLDEEVVEIDETTLGLYQWNRNARDWEFVTDTRLSVAHNVVSALVSKTGVFTILATTQTLDTIPPSIIGNLEATTGSAAMTVQLTWTAPGDDGIIGQAVNYDLRYNSLPIDIGNWDSCDRVHGEPLPGIGGFGESMTVLCPIASQTYYFGIIAEDEAGNKSSISNIVSVESGQYECIDTDSDGFGDPGNPGNDCALDNCPNDVNPDQNDTDSDGLGDVCDPDDDDDSVLDDVDNCPKIYNPDQADSDLDNFGDACDKCAGFNDGSDGDIDGIPDSCDNCPDSPNQNQLDEDADGLGAECDNCPYVYNLDQLDIDFNGIGDVCEGPLIDIRPSDNFNFGRVYLGECSLPYIAIEVHNVGTGTLSGSVTVDSPFIVVSGGSYDGIGSGGFSEVLVKFCPSVEGSVESNMTFTGGGGANVTLMGEGEERVPTKIHVSPSGDDIFGDGTFDKPYSTIQYAVDRALDEDTVLVLPGHYIGRIQLRGYRIILTSNYLIDKDTITISQTILDGNPAVLGDSSFASVIAVNSGEDSSTIITGFTIINGVGTLHDGRFRGGGIYCYNGSSPTIEHNTITQCQNGAIGSRYSSPIIRYNTIHDNPGAGITIDWSVGRPIIDNNLISNNMRGISFRRSKGTITRNRIMHNSYQYNGAGIFLDGQNHDSAKITYNIIAHNIAGSGGGGVNVEGITVDFRNNTIVNNQSPDAGGIWMWGDESCMLGFCWHSRNTLLNNIIGENGGVNLWLDSSAILVEQGWNDVYGGSWGNAAPVPTDISCDPLFCDPDRFDFAIPDTSCCWQAGQDSLGNAATIGAVDTECSPRYSGPVWHVAMNGSDITGDGSLMEPYRTIQYSVDAAHDGDTIMVAIGTYTENVFIDSMSIVIASSYLESDDTLDIQETILDGSSAGTVISIAGESTNSVKLIGLVVTKGRDLWGGGVKCQGGVNVIVEYCSVHDNSAGHGAGLLAELGSRLSVSNCNVSFNSAGEQGFAAGSGIHVMGNGHRITNCTISYNNFSEFSGGSSDNIYGCGVYAEGDSITISHNNISNNTACVETETNCSGYGAGAYLSGNDNIFSHNDVLDNRLLLVSDGAGADARTFGGGVYASGTIDIEGNLFCNNFSSAEAVSHDSPSASASGGGVYVWSGNIYNNTFYRNTCSAYSEHPEEPGIGTAYATGGALFVGFGGGLSVQNNIMALNVVSSTGSAEAGGYYGNTSYLKCNDFWVNSPDHVAPGYDLDLDSNWIADPVFCDTSGSNFHVADISPCAPANNPCGNLVGAQAVGCIIEVPEIPNLVQPQYDTTIQQNLPMFEWTGNGDYYSLEIATDSLFTGSNLLASLSPIHGTFHRITDPLPFSDYDWMAGNPHDPHYYWRIKAHHGSGISSDFSDVHSFVIDGPHEVPAEYPSIREARAAFPLFIGGTVLVAPGIYKGSKNCNIGLGGELPVDIISTGGPDSTIIDCEFTYPGFNYDVFTVGEPLINGFTIRNGGAVVCRYGLGEIKNCIIEHSPGSAVQVSYNGRMSIHNTIVRNCFTGIEVTTNGSVEASRCVITGNNQWGVDLYMEDNSSAQWAVFDSCLFDTNGVGNMRVAGINSLIIKNSTFVRGSTCGISFTSGSDVTTISNTIIGFTEGGPGVEWEQLENDVVFSCCDIFGNVGGDWIGRAEPQLGINGNFSVDPLFCNIDASDYSIDSLSPCAMNNPLNICQSLIGALKPTCQNQSDSDGDNIPDTLDNCPTIYNPEQEDENGNDVGDVCEGCCGFYTRGYTGNTDCSDDGKRNLGDITRLIDKVYVSKEALCCKENGNIDGDVDGKVNLGDITKLIDNVYLSKEETVACE